MSGVFCFGNTVNDRYYEVLDTQVKSLLERLLHSTEFGFIIQISLFKIKLQAEVYCKDMSEHSMLLQCLEKSSTVTTSLENKCLFYYINFYILKCKQKAWLNYELDWPGIYNKVLFTLN